MATCTFGRTQFEFSPEQIDGTKVKIFTAEGSVIAVPAEDLLQFLTAAYVIPQRNNRVERRTWQDVLFGEAPR